MLIQPRALQHWIDNFYGYGSWNASIWFVGYEETGGDLPEDVASKIDYFRDANPQATGADLCDIRELYRKVSSRADGPKSKLFTTLHDYRFGGHATLHGVWKNLISFVHGYNGEPLPDLLSYQKNAFVAPSSQEALIQLYPLPSPHAHAWYYSWLDIPGFGFLKSRGQYEDYVYQKRISTIMGKVAEHKPSLVLLHGMNNINTLKDSIREVFPGAKFRMVKAEKLVTPQYHRADADGITILVTTQIPALRHGRKETGFDWQRFGEAVKLGGS